MKTLADAVCLRLIEIMEACAESLEQPQVREELAEKWSAIKPTALTVRDRLREGF